MIPKGINLAKTPKQTFHLIWGGDQLSKTGLVD